MHGEAQVLGSQTGTELKQANCNQTTDKKTVFKATKGDYDIMSVLFNLSQGRVSFVFKIVFKIHLNSFFYIFLRNCSKNISNTICSQVSIVEKKQYFR
jgi:hypothetical protein